MAYGYQAHRTDDRQPSCHEPFEEAPSDASDGGAAASPVTDRSLSEGNIALFRPLSAGREELSPSRRESARTVKAACAPADTNEWKPVLVS